MITEKIFINERFFANEVGIIFRKLLVSRAIVEQGEEVEMASKKKRFSELIEDIMIKTNQEKAKELLEVGFLNLPRDEDKGFIAQALARLQIEQFTEAERWAEEAITLLPYNFTMYDTIGQVYKRALRYSKHFSSRLVVDSIVVDLLVVDLPVVDLLDVDLFVVDLLVVYTVNAKSYIQ